MQTHMHTRIVETTKSERSQRQIMSEGFKNLLTEIMDENYEEYASMGSVDPKHD